MKNVTKVLALGVALAITTSAHALGVDAGTTVSNSATVNYQTGGVAQPAESDSVDFLVDRKVIFTVTSNGNASVVPASTGQVLAYTIAHTGNYTADFSLSAVNDTGDDFDPSSSAIFVEDGTTVGYQSGEDTETFVDELAEGGSIIVYIVSTIPAATLPLANGDTSVLHLVATAGAGGAATTEGAALAVTGAPDVAMTVENVFGDAAGSETGSDAANDGQHSDDGTYTVAAAEIQVTKSSIVVSDPVHGTDGNQKRILGAVIQYVIEIENLGGVAATSLTIADDLTEALAGNGTKYTYVPGSILIDEPGSTDQAEDDNAIGADETNDGAGADTSNNGASFSTGTGAGGADQVLAQIGNLAGGAIKRVKFSVTLN